MPLLHLRACALLAAKSNFLSAFLKLCALLTPNYLASRLPLYGTSTDLPRLKGAAFPIRLATIRLPPHITSPKQNWSPTSLAHT